MELTAQEYLIKYLDDCAREITKHYSVNYQDENEGQYNEGLSDGVDALTNKIISAFKMCSECEREMFHCGEDYVCIGCRSKI